MQGTHLPLPRRFDPRISTRGCASSTSKRLVSTPIFYVNAAPHIGHVYSALLCDAYARWLRITPELLDSVIFSTGTDEHGAKVFDAAESCGKDCKSYCDEVSAKFRVALDVMNVTYDRFIRTTEKQHIRTAQGLWKRLVSRGYIYTGMHRGWYCRSDEAFLTELQTEEREVGGAIIRVSKESGHPVEMLDEANYVFKLAALRQPLREWLQRDPSPIHPRSRLKEVEAWLDTLEDLSISRPASRVRWGIPVVDSEAQLQDDGSGERIEQVGSQTMYVWLDALTNYLTACDVDVDKLERGDDVDWAQAVHVIGKDILRFHAVYWPAFLIAAGLPLPERIVVHGHWTVDGVKMSKSLGNVVDPMQLYSEVGAEAVRYFLLCSGGLEHDADYTSSSMVSRFNDEVVNVLGNLLSRSSSRKILVRPFRRITIEDMRVTDPALIEKLNAVKAEVEIAVNDFAFPAATKAIFNVMREVNGYFTEHEPWKLAKNSEANGEALDEVCYVTLSAVRIAAILLLPIIPGKCHPCNRCLEVLGNVYSIIETSTNMLDSLGVPSHERNITHARVDHELTLDIQSGGAFQVRRVEGSE